MRLPTLFTLSELVISRSQNLTRELHVSEPEKEFVGFSKPVREWVESQLLVIHVSGLQSLTKKHDYIHSELRVILQGLK